MSERKSWLGDLRETNVQQGRIRPDRFESRKDMEQLWMGDYEAAMVAEESLFSGKT